MKKILVVIITVVFVAILMSSCHAKKHCPAYGQIETENTDLDS